MIRRESELIANIAKESGLLEQRVMIGEELEDPEAFLEELFQAWYVLLAIRTIATHSSATYGRMARLVRFLPDAAPHYSPISQISSRSSKPWLTGSGSSFTA